MKWEYFLQGNGTKSPHEKAKHEPTLVSLENMCKTRTVDNHAVWPVVFAVLFRHNSIQVKWNSRHVKPVSHRSRAGIFNPIKWAVIFSPGQMNWDFQPRQMSRCNFQPRQMGCTFPCNRNEKVQPGLRRPLFCVQFERRKNLVIMFVVTREFPTQKCKTLRGLSFAT